MAKEPFRSSGLLSLSLFMKYLFQNSSLSFLLTLFVFITIGGCGRRSAVWEKMDIAGQCMEVTPDSALLLLEEIDVTSLNDDKEKARYALLKSMAYDKNYIDTTSFDILQPAIDYYSRHGSPDEKMLTYYYQGRISCNRGEPGEAMRYFLAAEQMAAEVTDTLGLARLLVAQGVLYYKQYKLSEFIANNLRAGDLYGKMKKPHLQIRCYAKAMDITVLLDQKPEADSIKNLCVGIIEENPIYVSELTHPFLSYAIKYGGKTEVNRCLIELRNAKLTDQLKMDVAHAYATLGMVDSANIYIQNIELSGNILDSLKYMSIKKEIDEISGQYREAVEDSEVYEDLLMRFHSDLFNNGLLFAEEKHKLEMDTLLNIRKRDRFILINVCIILGLLIFAAIIYYQLRLARSKRIIAEQDNDRLRLGQEILRKKNENLKLTNRNNELELAQRILTEEKLRLEKDNIKLEADKLRMETDNLKITVTHLDEERMALQNLLDERKELDTPVKDVIKHRLDMLNSLLAKEITSKDSYAKPYNQWLESIRKDKKEFLNSTRVALSASHPAFIEYLKKRNLQEDEINYLCLYAIGLSGKDAGEYIQLKRHYNMSSTIRRKLGLNEHETNLTIYVRRLLSDS